MAEPIHRKGRGFTSGGARYDGTEQPAPGDKHTDVESTANAPTLTSGMGIPKHARREPERDNRDERRRSRSRSHGRRRRSRSRSRSRGRSQSQERDGRDRDGDRDRDRSYRRGGSRDGRRSRSRSRGRDERDYGRGGREPMPPPPLPMMSKGPTTGAAIVLSNTRKTAEAVARANAGTGLVTEDALAALKARLAGTLGAGVAGNLSAAAAQALASIGHGAQVQAQQPVDSSGGAAAALGSAMPSSAPSMGSGMPSLGLGLAMGMPSGTTVIQAPAGVNVNVGASPAQAAGMLGPGGLVSLLASVSPTRVLVVYNCLTDALLESGRAAPTSVLTDVAEVAVDIMVEAQRAAPGALLRMVVPLPSVQGELIDPPVGVKLGGSLRVVGASGLLEDSKEGTLINVAQPTGGTGKDGPVIVGANMEGAKVIPLTAEEFYRKVAGAGSGWSSGLEGLPGTMGTAGFPSGQDEDQDQEGGHGGGADGSSVLDANGRTRGLGKVYLEFSTSDAAVAAQKELAGRFFEGRITVATFAHPAKFVAGDLCALGPPGALVFTASNAPTGPWPEPAAAPAPVPRAAPAPVQRSAPPAAMHVPASAPAPAPAWGGEAAPGPSGGAQPALYAPRRDNRPAWMQARDGETGAAPAAPAPVPALAPASRSAVDREEGEEEEEGEV